MKTNQTVTRLQARGFNTQPFMGGAQVFLPRGYRAQIYIVDNAYRGEITDKYGVSLHFIGFNFPQLCNYLDRYSN